MSTPHQSFFESHSEGEIHSVCFFCVCSGLKANTEHNRLSCQTPPIHSSFPHLCQHLLIIISNKLLDDSRHGMGILIYKQHSILSLAIFLLLLRFLLAAFSADMLGQKPKIYYFHISNMFCGEEASGRERIDWLQAPPLRSESVLDIHFLLWYLEQSKDSMNID